MRHETCDLTSPFWVLNQKFEIRIVPIHTARNRMKNFRPVGRARHARYNLVGAGRRTKTSSGFKSNTPEYRVVTTWRTKVQKISNQK
jgi:hypothetical protein